MRKLELKLRYQKVVDNSEAKEKRQSLQQLQLENIQLKGTVREQSNY